MKKLPIKIPLLLIISYLFCFNVQAETETTTDTAPTEVSKEASSMLKAEKLLTNISAENIRRVDLVFGIGYEDSIAQAEQVLQNIIDADERILKDPEPTIKVNALGESSVDFIQMNEK